MFIAQAHSFAQQARLAITLAWVAGYTNIIALLTCGHVTSHVSGTASDLGRGIARGLGSGPGAWSLVGFAMFLLATFLLGALVSGISTELARRRGWESMYVLPMAIQATLLGLFAVGVELHDQATVERGLPLYAMTGLASAAMGLQNATITHISSGVVRTTHVTGVLTDIGLELAQVAFRLGQLRKPRGLLRALRANPGARRLALLASIIGSFALGAGLGTLAFDQIARWAMFPPVLFLVWIIFQDLRRPIAELEESSIVGDAQLELPPGLLVYRVSRDSARPDGVQRLPNLAAWADRLPDFARVVILDLTDVVRLAGDAAYELRAMVARLEDRERRLILAGVTREQFEQLRAAGAGSALAVGDACPDLELAIARGMVALEMREDRP